MARGDIKLLGVEELTRSIKKLGPFGIKAMAFGARKGAVLIAKDVEQRAPRDAGDLADSILVRKRKSATPKAVKFIIGPRKGRATSSVAFYNEFGVDAAIAGGRAPGAIIPARPPQPFMRPAFDAQHDKAIDLAVRQTVKGIERQVKRINSGKAKLGRRR